MLTKELLKKISEQISEAAFLIADVTGNNANVLFELGIAHERNKPVIFLTQDDPKNAPIDIRQFEFIEYQLDKHEYFLVKLDNAVRNVLGASLNIPELYDLARELLRQFNAESGFTHVQVSREYFQEQVVRVAGTQEVPRLNDRTRLESFLLPKIVQDIADMNVSKRVREWLANRESAKP